jgi:hypothetical protein
MISFKYQLELFFIYLAERERDTDIFVVMSVKKVVL